MVLVSDGQQYLPTQAQNSSTLEYSQQMPTQQMAVQTRAGVPTATMTNASGLVAGSTAAQSQQSMTAQEAYGRGTDLTPETAEMPPWGPHVGNDTGTLPESPETPSWGPPIGEEPGCLPESPETPPWGPPVGYPEIPSVPDDSFEGYCNIRFLYAAVDQPPLNIRINGQAAINNFQYGNVTPYYLEEAGPISITLTSIYNPGFALLRTRFNFQSGYAYTIAIINSATGIQLYAITDNACQGSSNAGCVRAINLSYGSGPLDVFLSAGGRIFRGVDFKSITPYRQLRQGAYRAYVSESLPCVSNQNITISGNAYVACNGTRIAILDSTMLNVMNNVSYTLYIIGRAYQFPALQLLPVESDLIY